MAAVYILYSPVLDRFYTGSCIDFEQRFQDHQSKKYIDSFTSNASDWELYLRIDKLSYRQARAIERHIKKMKSRIYIENLLKYPEMVQKLINRYK